MIISTMTGIEDNEFPFNSTATPAVYIDLQSQKLSPLALGDGKILKKKVALHIIGNDQKENILYDVADLLAMKQYTTTRMIDVDKIPQLLDWRRK